MLIRLLKAWQFDGHTFDENEVLKVDKATGEMLVKDGTAEVEAEGQTDGNTEGGTSDKSASTDAPKSASTNGAEEGEHATFSPEIVKALATENERLRQEAQQPRVKVVQENWTKNPGLNYCENDNGPALAMARGRWLLDVRKAATEPPTKQLRVCQKHLEAVRKKALGSDEYAALEDTIGGFFIQPEFDDRLLTKGFEQEWIRSNGAQVMPTNASMVKINAEVDKDRQTNLYGGINVFWQGERQQITSAKGKFEQIELKPDWLTGLYYVTETLLRSAPAIGAIIGRQFRDAFQRKETLAFLSGSGQGEPLGVLNSDGAYTVTRDTAAKIKHEDVVAMMARQADPDNAVWIFPRAAYTELTTMGYSEAVGGVGAWGTLTWLTSLVGKEPATLLNRPVIFTEHAPALAALGGAMLVAWNHYLIAESSDFIADSSIHVRFDSLETAYRFAKRVDGQPWWRSTLTQQNGWEVSPYVLLSV